MSDQALRDAVEAAFEYRGHVTLTLTDGSSLEGYLFNRDLDVAAPFVQLFLAGSGDARDVPLDSISSVEHTGKDHAVPFTPPQP